MAGSHVHAVAFAATTTNTKILDVGASDAIAVYGFWFTESTGTAVAEAELRQGSSTGQPIVGAKLATGTSAGDYWGPDGVHCDGDLYVTVVGGSVKGGIYYG